MKWSGRESREQVIQAPNYGTMGINQAVCLLPSRCSDGLARSDRGPF